MRIDELNVALRARNPWESFDLGFALARHTGFNLYLAFVLPYFAFALLVNVFIWGHPTAAMLIIWWVKPAFDRIALSVVSQAVFAETPSWRTTINGLLKIPRTGLLYALTFGRFDFARSFHLAVYQLEGQTGRARRQRITVLDRTVRGSAVWLTVVVIHFAYVMVFGFDGLLRMIAPQGAEFSLRLGDFFAFGANEPSLLSQYLFNLTYVLAECVLEPLYVSAGFALYISRRTVLEGWDLEVAFKRMTARIEAAGALLRKSALMVLAVVMLQASAPRESWAQEAAGAAVPLMPMQTVAVEKSPEKRLIEDILSGPDFKQFEERKTWRPKNTPEKKARDIPTIGDGWITFARIMAEVFRVAIWVVAIVVLGWLLYYLSRRLGWFRDVLDRRAAYKPDVLFGLDLRAGSLPDDIPAAARALLVRGGEGDMRAALSLLYRGALRVLIHERDLTVSQGDTEGDCVRRVSRAAPAALTSYFRTLVDTWGLIAYARRVPALAVAERLVDEWARHFMVQPDTPDIVHEGAAA